MSYKDGRTVQQAYSEVADTCGIENARHKPWASTSDSALLNKVLKRIDKENDRILDLGCCGYPWITNFLHREGYNVVGIDIHKPHWHDNNLVENLGVPLVAYDGENIPFSRDSFDLVLMFGVLEHVGVWKSEEDKYQELVPDITRHRQTVLNEVHRVISNTGKLYITKFPNEFGRDKYIQKIISGNIGHLNSERARPQYLRNLIGEKFEIGSMFTNGLLPHRIPTGTPSYLLPSLYAKFNHLLSNLPILEEIAQNYCIIATPR